MFYIKISQVILEILPIRWLLGTKLKHSGARYLLPVFDDTDQKSVFSVSVAHPKEIMVLSNMPLRTLNDT